MRQLSPGRGVAIDPDWFTIVHRHSAIREETPNLGCALASSATLIQVHPVSVAPSAVARFPWLADDPLRIMFRIDGHHGQAEKLRLIIPFEIRLPHEMTHALSRPLFSAHVGADASCSAPVEDLYRNRSRSGFEQQRGCARGLVFRVCEHDAGPPVSGDRIRSG